IYIDSFGNVISNIRKEDFERYGDDINFRIYYRRKDYIDTFVDNYADVPRGMAMAHFNSSGYLEIGINYGNAAQLLGLKIGTLIKIEII
ncbi:MAG TPA: SAM-dependent chlorinase/fluorinase, partial [Chitinophagales bacterium]|nr:SAM-dependent chlorinase/fluorinase [Chitinophagales bacterium]